jgi:hypothetical protein
MKKTVVAEKAFRTALNIITNLEIWVVPLCEQPAT